MGIPQGKRGFYTSKFRTKVKKKFWLYNGLGDGSIIEYACTELSEDEVEGLC